MPGTQACPHILHLPQADSPHTIGTPQMCHTGYINRHTPDRPSTYKTVRVHLYARHLHIHSALHIYRHLHIECMYRIPHIERTTYTPHISLPVTHTHCIHIDTYLTPDTTYRHTHLSMHLHPRRSTPLTDVSSFFQCNVVEGPCPKTCEDPVSSS